MSLSKLVISTALLASSVQSHSWVHCTDYDGTITGQDFNEDLCNGYIRAWSSQWGATSFATDRGINYQSGGPNWCQSDFSAGYDTGYPMAQWNYGETVTIVWPAKNHANYVCSNNIPDTSMKLYYNPQVNPTADPTGSEVTEQWSLLVDWQEGCTPGSDGCGFQNCPEFCTDTDAAPCFGKYTVSQSHFPSAGVYTLMWYWIFNPGTPYTTCFEVEITGDTVTDSGNSDDTSDGDSDSGSSPTYANFIVSVPICMTNVQYDSTTLIDGANNAGFESDTTVSWFTASSVKGDQSSNWNVTIQTSTNNAGDVTLTSYDYADDESELCDSIAEEFGVDDSNCYICDPGTMVTYGLVQDAASGIWNTWMQMVLMSVSAFLVCWMS